jgi:hypothetical protein
MNPAFPYFSFARALHRASRRAGGLPLRNASLFTVYTPGLVLAEMRTVDEAVRSLGRDVFRQLCAPFDAAQGAAEAVFRATYGRASRAGSDADWREVARFMGTDPDGLDADQRCFQGAFVQAFRGFVAEWDKFFAENSDFGARLWGGVYDKVLDYKARAADWRRRFEELGGRPSAPAPRLPAAFPWTAVYVAGGVLAGLLVLRAVRP